MDSITFREVYKAMIGMKTIPLTKGKVALVDDIDFAAVSACRWYAYNSRRCERKGKEKWYAVGRPYPGSDQQVFMHRFIMGNDPRKRTDHRNGDGLDNQRHNLRIATQRQNQGNMICRSSAGFKGVFKRTNESRYTASIHRSNGVKRHLGSFDTAEDAALAYDKAARVRWRAFACVNFPRPGERSALTGEIIPTALTA